MSVKDRIAELEESIGRLEALKREGKNAELAADVESGIIAVERVAEEKAAGARRHVDAKIREMENSISLARREIEALKSSAANAGKACQPDAGSAKKIMEMKSRMDVLQKYVEGKLRAADKKIDSISKIDLEKLGAVAKEEEKIDENLKIFALNSDVEKVWKEIQGLRKYVDDKTKSGADLSKSLEVWESRNLKMLEKERLIDERLDAFPDLKLIESRIRKLERAIADLQRRFVSSQAMNPVILE